MHDVTATLFYHLFDVSIVNMKICWLSTLLHAAAHATWVICLPVFIMALQEICKEEDM